jgi:hypothetical protein
MREALIHRNQGFYNEAKARGEATAVAPAKFFICFGHKAAATDLL